MCAVNADNVHLCNNEVSVGKLTSSIAVLCEHRQRVPVQQRGECGQVTLVPWQRGCCAEKRVFA